MSIGGIGSTTSFWQQDQNYWQQQQQSANETAASDSVINAISSAETSLGKGLASIANKTALNRVNSQLSAAIENILEGNTGSSTTGSTPSSNSSSQSSSSAKPAVATGTAPLTLGTPLSTLGILAGGIITVRAGDNTTTYASSGSDTVGDLMASLNNHLVGNAAVTTSLNSTGDLVITSSNTTDTITIGGVYASNIGFAVGHQTFKPTAAASGSSGTTSTSTASSSSSSTSPSSSTSTKKSYTTLASEISSGAASLLSDSGVGGTLVDLLA